MKKIVKIIIFLFGLNIILYSITYTLLPKHNGYNSIDYFKHNNQLDIIFLGPSTTYYAVSPMYIWNKYNITSFNNAHNSQRLTMLFALEDMKKYKPKLIFFDIVSLLNGNSDFITNQEIDKMQLKWYLSTLSRLQYLKYTNGDFKDIFYWFSLDIFHTRWKNISEQDFINNNKTYYFMGGNPIFKTTIQKHSSFSDNVTINEDIIALIHTMAKYIKENNLNVVFWCPPVPFINTTNKIWLNRYERSFLFDDIIKQYDIPYINFNKIEKSINLDYNKDFFDSAHLNLYGGNKVTDYLIEYAIKNYNIPNHKNDPKYASWNEDYKKYARAINREEIRELKSFNEWKKLAFYDNYTVMISVNGDILKKLPDTLKNDLKSFGLTKYNTDKPNMRYVAIIDDNTVFFEEISNKPVIYKDRMKNIVNLLIKSDGKSTINVSGKPRSKNKYGLNFVIYDKINREIVDSIWIDPNKPDVVRR